MKRLAWIAAGLAALVVVGLVLVLLLFDAEQLREPIISAAERALGREVKLGELDLAVLPLPAVRVREIEIAGPAPQDPPFARVEELRLRVSVLPLLAGQIVLRALEVESPRVHIPLDADGSPILPGGAAGTASEPAREAEAGVSDGAEEAAAPMLAVERIVISDAAVEFGDWRVEHMNVDGTLRLDGSGDFRVEAELAGLGRIHDGRVLLSGLFGSALAVDATAGFDVDLRATALLLELEQQLDGRAQGQVSFGLAGGELVAASAVIELGANSVELRVDLASERTAIAIEPVALDLAALGPFLGEGVPALGGTLRIASMGARLEPLELSGAAQLEDVSVALEHDTLSISGDLSARGSRIRLDNAVARVGQESAQLSGSYDLEAGEIALDADFDETNLGALLQSLAGSSDFSGRLNGRVSLRGPPGLLELDGGGDFAIDEGRIKGFSLLREILGELATVIEAVAITQGKDLSRFEEEAFELLSADYKLSHGTLTTENLTLVYKNATAYLRGSVGLEDGALDLSGRIELSKQVDLELGQTSQTRRTVIPIAAIAGTVTRPRVRLDRQALVGVAAELSASGVLGDELEKQLGKEGADAVQDLLKGIFGGRKR